MKIEKAKQILERCANESARLLIKNANNADRRPAEVKKECARVAYSSFLENIKQRNQSKRKWWRKTK